MSRHVNISSLETKYEYWEVEKTVPITYPVPIHKKGKYPSEKFFSNSGRLVKKMRKVMHIPFDRLN